MRKKLILFTQGYSVLQTNMQDLQDVFGDVLDIEGYSFDQYIAPHSITGDLAISVSTVSLYEVEQYLRDDVDMFCGARTLTKESYQKLKDLPAGTRALTLSAEIRGTLDFTRFLQTIGIDHLHFYPVYEELPQFPEADVLICPKQVGEIAGLPDLPRIDIGSRQITAETYRAIARSLGVYSEGIEARIYAKTKHLVEIKMFDISVARISALQEAFDNSLESLADAVVIANAASIITYFNSAFVNLFFDIRHVFKQPSAVQLQEYKDLFQIIYGKTECDSQEVYLRSCEKKVIVTKQKMTVGNQPIKYMTIFRAVLEQKGKQQAKNQTMQKNVYGTRYTFADIIGENREMQKTKENAKRIAKFEKTTLILGESGVGKEMFAQAMHNESSRAKMPFIAINCGAISADLLETELFGYEDGAFTGAKKGGKKGLFEIAHRGTIFLDEIGNIPMDMQIKILRFLQEREVRRVGGENTIAVDAWVIAATNSDLLGMVSEGTFRLDLYYRLNVFQIQIAPLNQRREDIPLIAEKIVETLNELEKQNKIMSEDVKIYLMSQSWQGNVRELQNVVQYMYYMSDTTVTLENLPQAAQENVEEVVVEEISMPMTHVEKIERETSMDLAGNLLPERWKLVFTKEEQRELDAILAILRLRSMGRRKLHGLMREQGFVISEYKLRQYLDFIKENGLEEEL